MKRNNLNENKEKEWVNHPDHYNNNNKYECIDVMLDTFGKQATIDFCLLSAFKYIYRCNKKHDSPIEDLKKTIWYLNEIVELEESGEKGTNN